LREPDEINIENIKNRVSSNPGEIQEKKSRMKFEEKLSKDYIKDDEHARIKQEIEKTMRELYGENSTISYSYNNRKL
jgi:predicted  nucleic acid-binding Zn-ribbon protein